jgi:tripartite-type tricarboxylate transporter receptor subunit TctC
MCCQEDEAQMLRLTSRLFVAGLSLTVATSMATSSSVAQNYPSGPIKLVVPFSPGGGTDVIARSLTQRLSERLGRSVVIENRSGASGLTGALSVAQAKPDGYTLLLTAQTPITIAGHFTGARKAPYDPMTDLKAVALLFYAPVVLLAKSTFPARSLTELVQYAKRNPGSLSYGVAGVGNELHLAWEALRNAASLDVLLVPYQGTGPAMRDVIAGHVSLFMTATSTVKGYLDDGCRATIKVRGERQSG